jgi:hypothetical protein
VIKVRDMSCGDNGVGRKINGGFAMVSGGEPLWLL